MHKAIFLDKDGTLVSNHGYPQKIPTSQLLTEQVIAGLQHLQKQGYTLIIISNQPWIAKGIYSRTQVETIFDRLLAQLWFYGITIHDYFYCPHQSADNCSCKKPLPELIFKAARKHSIDLSQSYFFGDLVADVIAGKRAGVKTILVETGCGLQYSSEIKPDFVIKNINAIIEVIP